jgi:chemotaxis protein methyltransferase CheR
MTMAILGALIEHATGLDLERGGVSAALQRFVTARLHALGLPRVEDYVALASDPRNGEQQRLIDAITVPHTWFYRDPDQLRTVAQLMTEAPPGRIHVWVAGCATGEEAYTMAMIGRRIGREVTVLASDINETALAHARRGFYGALAVKDVPEIERRWITRHDNRFVVDDALRSSVTFVRHNLVEPPPDGPRNGWDLVVCRNVLIYFAPNSAAQVFKRFARAVREGGAIVVGASEVVFEPPAGLELVSSGNRLVLHRPVRAAPSPQRRFASHPPPAPKPTAEPQSTAEPRPAPEPQVSEFVAALVRGHALFERGEIGAAIPIYRELARHHPSDAEPWLFLGIAHYAHGDVDAAADALRASLCLAPSLWPAGFYLARAYERQGRSKEAMQQYDRIAVDDLRPFALQSTSAVINELRAFQHDFRAAARRVAAERSASTRRLLK